jgi:hypothetical protein
MSTLADALEAYELAIANGAPSIDIALRFAELKDANHAYVHELAAAEEATARVWGQLLPCLDAPDECVTICSTCGMPTESEPCEKHQPVAYARCNA